MKTLIIGIVAAIILGATALEAHKLYMEVEMEGCRKTFLDLINLQQPLTPELLKELNPKIERQCRVILE
jgi:hypothetical protein